MFNTVSFVVHIKWLISLCVLAVYFEMKQYDDCIATCEKAVDVGRENRADFTIIAKYVPITLYTVLLAADSYFSLECPEILYCCK